MHIMGGKYKGRAIHMPKGIRPTQDKVRKALFDILGDIKGLSFLELFAGSGIVAIEALSQGAKEVVFVERDKRCLKTIKENILLVGSLGLDVELLGRNVFIAIKQLKQRKEKFDIIFLDPPYYRDLAKKTLQALSQYDILAPNGFVIIQHFKRDNLPDASGVLTLFKQARYGDTLLSFYRKS